jgi:hypothetical protein
VTQWPTEIQPEPGNRSVGPSGPQGWPKRALREDCAPKDCGPRRRKSRVALAPPENFIGTRSYSFFYSR